MHAFSRLAIALVTVFGASTAAANTATQPVPRDEAWLRRHEDFVAEARRGGIDVVFLGDSLTDLWRREGCAAWEKHFAPLRAANFGIDGDRTQHLLWRLLHGAVDGPAPKVVVLLIGTNNTGHERNSDVPRNTTTEAIAGVTLVVQTLRAKLPDTTILLLGLLPRGERGSPIRAQVGEINRALSGLDDGRRIRFLDLGPGFLSPDGSLSREIMPDLLHMSEAGYDVFAAALRDPLARLLAANR